MYATAKIATTDRFQLAENVTHDLRLLQGHFVPVMPPGSELFVSAVSPIAAFGHRRQDKPLATISRADESAHDAPQSILIKLGAGEAVAATMLLLMALAVCISSLLLRNDRRRQGYVQVPNHVSTQVHDYI